MTLHIRTRCVRVVRRWTIVLGMVYACLCSTLIAGSQPVGDWMEVRGIEHTTVDGQGMLIISLHNPTESPIQSTGMLSVVDAGGLEVQRLDVTSGAIPPASGGVLAVPLLEPLPEGRYFVTLVLRSEGNATPMHLGPHRVDVGTVDVGDTGSSSSAADNRTRTGFPSWLLLLGGATLIAIGLLFRHETGVRRRKRRVPEVAMVRKVQLKSTSPKKPATIKPLLPPDRRREG